jgi:deazaflavin-dependent oxidoreductase (nitroreductase family)
VNADGVRDRRATSTTLAPVGSSLLVRIVMRPLTKLLNPLVRKLAGGRHFATAAQVHHLGRRSGRMYVTPVGARLVGDTFVIPLTFGNQSDWSVNIRAAGSCAIRLGGRDYQAVRPELLNARDARPLVRAGFGPVERLSFRMLGIRQFLRLQSIPNHLEPIRGDQ